jgi:flavorubredoxin
MQAYQIKDEVYWVGAIDWSLRTFHGYATERGSTYNAYLIIDEKITLIDNVKDHLGEEMMARISSVIDPSKIEVIISNHGEPDHSGNLVALMKKAPNAKVYASAPNGIKILNAIYGELPILPLKNGDELNIGKRTLKFIHAPMVHWPDSMVTYDAFDRILFSNDAFGQHFATSKRWDSDVELATALFEAKKYYANIVIPYSAQANRLLTAAKTLDLEIIAPSHGVIWKDHVADIIGLYDYLTTSQKQNKAVVVYDTMWESTFKIAVAITEAFKDAGIPVTLYDVKTTEISDIMTDLADAKYLGVGSSTINNGMLSSIAGFLNYLHEMAPTKLRYIAFGSYGWGGQSIQMIDEQLESMGYERLVPKIRINFVPKPNDLKQIRDSIMEALSKK